LSKHLKMARKRHFCFSECLRPPVMPGRALLYSALLTANAENINFAPRPGRWWHNADPPQPTKGVDGGLQRVVRRDRFETPGPP
jgi:hypothetical protein